MIGRKEETRKIQRLLTSDRSEFLAVTGRRRVGKTFLIDSLLGPAFCFSITGIQGGNLHTQLVNFSLKLGEYQENSQPPVPANWQEAFLQLKTYLKTLDKTKKHVLFFDELPWVYTPKSGFVQMLAHFWNDYLSKEHHFLLVICGSVTSWITKRILNDTGGLHNRITEIIHLHPFTLSETHAFLLNKGMNLTIQETARIYMTLGGIPFYLENLRKGESYASAIERMCFSPSGILKNEYANLYQALFNQAEIHQAIVAALAGKKQGASHSEILAATGLNTSGSYLRAIEELLVSDFIAESPPFGKKKRGTMYRLTDEYSIFYHRFIKQTKYTPGIWQQFAQSQEYAVWAGYAFEALCLKHIDEIKRVLGISAVYTEISSLYIPGNDEQKGFQIDLLIDRKDNSINLCEIKFHNSLVSVDKSLYLALLEKRQRFIEFTQTRKQVFLTFITNLGITPNAYSAEIVDAEITLENLVLG